VPGVALVTRGDEVVHAAGPPDAPYPAASVSKQFVAAVILLLSARGQLAPDDDISRWFGPWGRDRTVHQLLTHTAGLGHWDAVGGVGTFCSLDPAGRWAAIRDAPGVPGGRWSYSGLGYLLLAGIVERCTDVPYGDFLAAELLGPAGLTATTSGGPGLRSLPGTGDLVSTAADLTRWARRRPPDVSRTVGLGLEAYALPVVSAERYGYGVFTGTLANRAAVFHPGDNPGHQSLLATLADGTVLAVLLQDDTIPLSHVVATLIPHGL
jgi:CubicO group peptidase (beta-lactamase class C family)